jgi:hypothetical protein
MPLYQSSDGQKRWTRIVYAIQLSEEACKERKSPCRGAACGRTPVYVGQTCHTAADRFNQHKAGKKASRWVKRYGTRLMPRLTRDHPEFDTVADSVAAEDELARRLRRTGKYCVYGGH